MLHSQTHLRTRPIGAGNLRAFEAVARHLNFRAAAEHMALTQSAISRQIQSLEEEVGASLFLRHTRAVELTAAGAILLQAVTPGLERIDGAVRQIRATKGRKAVALTTFASFASLWLIPRLEAFQRDNPGVDIRIDATDTAVDMDTADVDIALRYGPAHSMPNGARRLFGEQLTPMVSPWLLQSKAGAGVGGVGGSVGVSLARIAELSRFTWIEASDAHSSHLDWLTWRRWLESQAKGVADPGLKNLEPQRWLYFNYAYQMVQAALTGQGVVLARLPLVAESVANGDLVEPLKGARIDSPMAYWLVVGPRSAARPEVVAFINWLHTQAKTTREAIGEVPDGDTLTHDTGQEKSPERTCP